MSIGGLIGGVVGGVVGFFVGGPTGAMIGFGIGFGAGTIIDPIAPDISSPGEPNQELQITTNTIGSSIPDLVGTGKLSGNLLCYGGERVEDVKKKTGGKGGGGKKQVVGHKYYASWALGLCLGKVDTLFTVYRNDEVVWSGELDCPGSGGEETITLDEMGKMYFYFGSDDQVANSKVGALLDDDTLNSPNRGLCWAFFDDCYIGDYNRIPSMKFVVKKAPEPPFATENKVIQTYDYNPAHAVWYTLCELAGLPVSWLHIADFEAVASTLSSEFRGMSILFDCQESTLTYLEMINKHIDGIIRYGSDGKFHPKLIRNDYDVNSLPLVDENVMLNEPTLTRKSWIDTINEMKVQYTELMETRDEEDSVPWWSPTNPIIMQGGVENSKVVEFFGGTPPFHINSEVGQNYNDETEGWTVTTEGLDCRKGLVTADVILHGYNVLSIAGHDDLPEILGPTIYASVERHKNNKRYWQCGQGLQAVYVFNEYSEKEELLFLHAMSMYDYDNELGYIRAFLCTNRSLEVENGDDICGELQPLAGVINLGSIPVSDEMLTLQCIKIIGNNVWCLFVYVYEPKRFYGFKIPWFCNTADWSTEYPATPVEILKDPTSAPVHSWDVEERYDGEISIGVFTDPVWHDSNPPENPHYIAYYDEGDLKPLLNTGGFSCGHTFDSDGNLWACDYVLNSDWKTVAPCRAGMWTKAVVDTVLENGGPLSWSDAEYVINLGYVNVDSSNRNWGPSDITYWRGTGNGTELFVSLNAYDTWLPTQVLSAVGRIYFTGTSYGCEIIHQEDTSHPDAGYWYSALSYDRTADRLYVEITPMWGSNDPKSIIEIKISGIS